MLSEMSWLDVFAEPEAADLPPDLRRLNRPLVLWYASAGHDFRPLVYTTSAYQERLSARIGEPLQFPEPNLFVYTCLDEKYEPWHEDEVLHEDYGTLVKCRGTRWRFWSAGTPCAVERGTVAGRGAQRRSGPRRADRHWRRRPGAGVCSRKRHGHSRNIPCFPRAIYALFPDDCV